MGQTRDLKGYLGAQGSAPVAALIGWKKAALDSLLSDAGFVTWQDYSDRLEVLPEDLESLEETARLKDKPKATKRKPKED